MLSTARPIPRGLVPTLALATFVNHLYLIAWNPFLPFIAEAQGVTVSVLGQIPAFMLLVSTFLGLVAGPLADSYGYRRALLVCLFAVVIGSLLTGLATALPVLFLAALFGSIARAAVMPVAQAIAAAYFAQDSARRRAVSRVQSGGPLAATLGVPCLTVIAAVLQWRAAFLAVSGLALGAALILRKTLRRDAQKVGGHAQLKEVLGNYAPLFRRRATLILIVGACVENAGVNAMWTYYGAFYVHRYAFSAEWVGWVSLAAGLGVLVGQAVAGGRFGARPSLLFVVGCAGSGTLIGLALMLPSPAAAAVALMAAGWLMHGLVMVSTVVLLVAEAPAGRATVLTLYGSAMNFGMALGAMLGGFILAWAGYFALGLCTAALPLAAAGLVAIHPGLPVANLSR